MPKPSNDEGFFDYWANWKALVKELSIAPSEAWDLDIVELYKLFDVEIEEKQDLSLMVNMNRIANGMNPKMIKNRL